MRRGVYSVFALLSALAFVVAVPADATEADESYDYIVIGSGPGGGPLACDLARAGYSTLLIEAGEDHHDYEAYEILFNFNWAANDDLTRWDFYVRHSDDKEREAKYERTVWRDPGNVTYVGLEPPEGSKRLGVWYPRAGTLGGCAMHNAGVCSLPADEDWNIVVELTGDESWEASKMNQYLTRIEENNYVPAGIKTHGYDGWLSTTVRDYEWARNSTDSGTKILKALAEQFDQDWESLLDPVATDILGLVPNKDQVSQLYQMAQHAYPDGRRSSPNDYIRATLADPIGYPLTLSLNTLATKVLFDTEGDKPRAIGVEVMKGKSLYRADPRHKGETAPRVNIKANREVIVAGGTFNSPQILKLSGIGPREELESFDIPVIVDLPGVGERLGDNYEGGVLALGKAPTGGGTITTIFKTPSAEKNRNIYAWCGVFAFEGFWPGFPDDYGPNEFQCALAHIGQKVQAGTVKLTSADPQDVPDVNLNFFSDGDQDLRELAEGINILRKAWSAAGEDVLPYDEMHPCPGETAGDCAIEDQMEYLELQSYSHHPTSTCAIGADDDELAVLDSKFRVRGVDGLRVVDASVFPRVPGAFPVLPTYIISAKAADSIIEVAREADGLQWLEGDCKKKEGKKKGKKGKKDD